MYNKDFVRRVFEAEAPCEDCDQADNCKQHEWACGSFSHYVLHGITDPEIMRLPSRRMFNKIFKEDEKALRNYLKQVKEKGEQDDLFE